MARSAQGESPFEGQGDNVPPVNRDPISMGLQQLFATVAEEPVPAEFLDLLDRIDAKEDNAKKPAPAPVVAAARGLAK